MQHSFRFSLNWLLPSLLPIFCASIVLWPLSCAKEQSAEERRREDERRDIERLNRGAGAFVGTVTLPNGGKVPFALDLAVAKNPDAHTGASQPALTAKMRLGLFEGVDLAAASSAFDAGSSTLTATFKDSSQQGEGAVGGKQLELQSSVAETGLVNAKLIAQGGAVYPITATRSETSVLGAVTAVSRDFGVNFKLDSGGSDAALTPALLTIKRLDGTTAAEATSDMPVAPKLEASLRFPGAGVVAHRPTMLTYDPLADSLDLVFGSLRLKFSHLSLDLASDGSRRPVALTFTDDPRLHGTVSNNGAPLGAVHDGGSSVRLALDGPGLNLPPAHFAGTFQAAPGTLLFSSVSEIEYLGTETVGASTVLNHFPAMKLKVTLCSGDREAEIKEYALSTLDYFAATGIFTETSGSREPYLFKFKYTNTWKNFEGRFVTGGEGGSDPGRVQLRMTAQETAMTCAMLAARTRPLTKLFATGDKEISRNEFVAGTDDSVMNYEGYLYNGASGGNAVPVGISIFPKRNPAGGAEEPALQVTARIGFLGGANIASEPAVFNWGNGRISASFTRPSGAPLEFRATLKPDVLDDAVLVGPNLGQRSMHLTRDGQPYSDATTDSTLNVRLVPADASGAHGPDDGTSGLRTVLTTKARAEGEPAPANIDLPTLPSMDASLRIDGLGKTPQLSKKVVYDVLRGTIDIYLSDSAVLEFNSIFLKKNPGNDARPYTTFTQIDGVISLGGQTKAVAHAELASANTRWTLQDLPYSIYVGTFQGSSGTSSGLRYKALGRIDYQGNAGVNTGEYPFGSYPNLNMTLTLCLGNQAFSRRNMRLDAVDYLSSKLIFKNREPNLHDDLEVVFTPGWRDITGEFRDTDGSSGSTAGSKVELTAMPSATTADCSIAVGPRH